MKRDYVRAMDAIYLLCVVVSGVALTIMTIVIPIGVFMRYVMNSALPWPEPLSVLLMVLFTFLAAASCYRAGVHISVALGTDLLPEATRKKVLLAADGFMAALALFMIVWGVQLCQITWYQVIAEFPFLSVGLTYLPIPLGGVITMLFVIERVWIGKPPPGSFIYREPASAD